MCIYKITHTHIYIYIYIYIYIFLSLSLYIYMYIMNLNGLMRIIGVPLLNAILRNSTRQ